MPTVLFNMEIHRKRRIQSAYLSLDNPTLNYGHHSSTVTSRWELLGIHISRTVCVCVCRRAIVWSQHKIALFYEDQEMPPVLEDHCQRRPWNSRLAVPSERIGLIVLKTFLPMGINHHHSESSRAFLVGFECWWAYCLRIYLYECLMELVC